MKLHDAVLPGTALLVFAPICVAQINVTPEDATAAIIRAFETHNIVMFGEIHGNKQEYEWLRSLVSTPAFADRVDDIVMEFGNSLYQKSVDRYIIGEDVPADHLQKAWRNLAGAVGPPSPVYGSLYRAVRDANSKRRGQHQMRIVCGDTYIDWDKINNREDLGPYLANREQWYAQVVKDEVLAKHHRALLIMGWGHFLRRRGPSFVEQQLQSAGASTYVIVFGTNTRGGYDDLDHRFDSWPVPAIVSLNDNWVGELPAMPVLSGGESTVDPFSPTQQKLKEVADALLYVGPRDKLTQLYMPRSELVGTPYGKEIERRLTIQLGQPYNFVHEPAEGPQFTRHKGNGAGVHLPPPPKSLHDSLPPRPVSQ